MMPLGCMEKAIDAKIPDEVSLKMSGLAQNEMMLRRTRRLKRVMSISERVVKSHEIANKEKSTS
jgi:hypothetical protein